MLNAPYGDVWDFEKAAYRSAPKFALAFFEEEEVLFESDERFLTKPSPITFDDLRAGEHYDARQETADWNTIECDESGWMPAIAATTPKGVRKLVEAEPILTFEEIKPVSVTKTPKGAYLYDFGVNFTGVCRLKIQGQRGQEVRLSHGEILKDGDLDMTTLGFDAFSGRELYNQCDWYTLKGGVEEIYTPRFTYHGFQYVSVEGLTDGQATLDLLTFEVMHSDVKKRGDFRCSDKILNVIQESTQRSDLSNLFYIPTDCPHREKNGWTGDVALSADQMLANFAVEKTLEEWLFNVRQTQEESGVFSCVVPTGGWGAGGAGPNWDDVLFECTYQIYRYSGNKQVIYDNIDAMERYLHFMQTKKKEDGLFCYGFGDWCQPLHDYQSTTPTELTSTVKCIDICEKAAKLARIVDREEVAVLADKMALEIRKNFRAKYIQNGKSTVSEQTAIAYILYYDIVEEKESLQKQLLEIIARDGEVFTTGVLGARTMFRVLSDMGESDLAYKLIVQPKFPSYGYHVLRGARTLPEHFYELAEEGWQQKDGQRHDSLNHHFWGDVSAWLICYVAGLKINPNAEDCNYAEISPNFISLLTFAEGEFIHTKGKITSRWDITEEGIRLRIGLPSGIYARLVLPKGYICDLSEKEEILFDNREGKVPSVYDVTFKKIV
jgi:alpha-L-rhamnosidase